MMNSEFDGFIERVRADLFRYSGAKGVAGFLRVWRSESGFRLSFHMRLCRALWDIPLTRCGVFHVCMFFYGRSCIRYGVHLSPFMDLAEGLYLPHPFAIVINSGAVIGSNCNILQCVTVGVSNSGAHPGVPTIGNRVFIGPGAVILGGISIGDGAAIGANAVVTRPVEAGTVVVGAPARCVSRDGSSSYMKFTLEDLDG